MTWTFKTLREVAPPQTSSLRFSDLEQVWHLNLDQIESNTGNILEKIIAPASDSGSSTYIFDENNVLYSKLRPYLNKVVCPLEPGVATTELVPLRPNPKLLNRLFLMYYLRSTHFLNFANVAVNGAKMPRLIMDKFWQHKIPLPPLPEQKRIAAILEQADAARAKRRKANTLTQQFLQSAFVDLFGDPATNPKGWNVRKIDDITERIQYGFTASSTQDNTGLKFLRITDIQDGQVDWKTVPYCVCDDSAKYQVKPGDIVFARTGATTGKSYLITDSVNAVFASYLIRMRLKREVEPAFVFHFFQTAYYWQQIQQNIVGSTQGGFNASKLAELLLPVPPIVEQRHFTEIVASMEKLRVKQRRSEQELENLFQSLLQKAFQGEL